MLARLAIASVLLAFPGLSTADDKKDEKKKDDKELIQGEWVVVDSSIKQQIGKKLIVKGEEWTSPMGQKFTITIDATKKPKELDLTTGADNLVFRGIYKLDGDKLTFCRAKTTANPRPTELKATPTYDLLVLKRPSRKD